MSAEELLDQGRLGESLDALQAEVRAAPADALKRLFLFQILSVMGQWDRALTQLNTAAQINSQLVLSATIYRAMIAAEQQRSLIFAGEKNPTIFGEPLPG